MMRHLHRRGTPAATDLWEILSSGMLDSTSNPDYSASGGLMQFGFWRGA